MEFTPEQIYEIVLKLTGQITPVADSAIDSQRKLNLDKFLEVFTRMHILIDDIAYRHKDSPYASQKELGVICDEYLTEIGIT